MAATLPERVEVLIVGAGLAGLACARALVDEGFDVHVVDAADAVGGRVRTDELDGFVLDRGFQVLSTAYDELDRYDTASLDLRAFDPGSDVWDGRKLVRMVDPFRDPRAAASALLAGVGTLADKMRTGALRTRLVTASAESAFGGDVRSTLDELHDLGFSDGIIDGFFRPFLGGVFLERDLTTSASLFRYYFRCFAVGDATVPARGMQRLPESIAAPVADRVTLRARVERVDGRRAVLQDGRRVDADHVVLAVDAAAAASLDSAPAPRMKATVTSYWAAPESPVDRPLLVLDGEGTGPVNHVAVMSRVSPEYAPEGMHLVAVSGVDGAADDPDLFLRETPAQLRRWFGAAVDGWSHLRTYRIPNALPRHPGGSLVDRGSAPTRGDGVVLAGDYTEFGSIQGALRSGRWAAETVSANSRG